MTTPGAFFVKPGRIPPLYIERCLSVPVIYFLLPCSPVQPVVIARNAVTKQSPLAGVTLSGVEGWQGKKSHECCAVRVTAVSGIGSVGEPLAIALTRTVLSSFGLLVCPTNVWPVRLPGGRAISDIKHTYQFKFSRKNNIINCMNLLFS